ncbi:MAG: 2-phospho-L-lactate guanylyltransferase [Chloroflexi bacterium]|nr:2-phospho-L-lactate guanylyltransferase [Chloroflexota bacterium]
MTPQRRNGLPYTRVIVPMKPLPEAKTRLRKHLPPAICDALVLFMLERVLNAVEPRSQRWWSCVVVGGDETVRRIAEVSGSDWVPEHASGLNEALRLAMQDAYADGVEAVLYLPGDVPLIQSRYVLDIVYAGRMLTRPVGVPAADGRGTNALFIPAGMQMELHFGENSYAKHRKAAKRIGTRIRTLKLPGLMMDIDTEAQYQWLRLNVQGAAGMILNWQEWLHMGIDAPPPVESVMFPSIPEQER